MYYQQGDVLIKKIDKSSEPNLKNAKKTESKKIILAEGEQTGHNHVLNSLLNMSIYKQGDETKIKTQEKSTIVHQEHNPFTILPDLYKIEIVKEYDSDKERARQVRD